MPEEGRLDSIGQRSATAWELGSDGMREAGFLLPPSLHSGLKEQAGAVRSNECAGEKFLDDLREALRFDDFFVAFVNSLERWEQGSDPPHQTRTPTDLRAGDELSGFEILNRIGEGGMGCVYRARQRSLNRMVAIKVLNSQQSERPQDLERFREEARAVAKLRHPNVVQILEARSESDEGPHYIVLEYVDGPSLEELIEERERLPEPEALKIVLDIARALECAERHGYIHRDVKPANILIASDRTAKLSDLGLARRLEEETRKTTAGMILGTPHYMAPEQALDELSIDIRADLYSLGVTLFHMVTGVLPFMGRTAISVISQHANLQLPDPNGFVEGLTITPGVSSLVHWLANRDLSDRYPSPVEAIRSIESVLADGPAIAPSQIPTELEGASAPGLPTPPKTNYFSRKGPLLEGFRAPISPPPTVEESEGHEETPTQIAKAPEAPPSEEDAPQVEVVVGHASLREEWANLARTHLISATGSPPEQPDPKPSKAEAGQLLLSDDTQRAYRIKRRLGEGTQGVVYEVEVMGRRDFPGFERPVERAVMKRAIQHEAIEQERLIYSQIDFRMVKLLDHGATASGRPYIVLERLRGTPFERYRIDGQTRVRTDPGTAIDIYVNLLDRLKGLHFRRKLPLVLCDIKPPNIMIRMPTLNGSVPEDEYIERLIAGRYEPVFVDLGCAQHRDVLREAKGRLRGLIGSPIFLPPESIPRFDEEDYVPGIYGPATDVYGLTLTFYEWISGSRPYHHLEHEWRSSPDPLLALFEMKRARQDPIDEDRLRSLLGDPAQAVIEVLRAGSDPDPETRFTTNKLLALCKRLFRLDHTPRDKKEAYAFDSPETLIPFRQTLIPPLDPQENRYRAATRVEPD